VWLGCNEEPCLVLNRFAIVIQFEELADLASSISSWQFSTASARLEWRTRHGARQYPGAQCPAMRAHFGTEWRQ
jgi:hypothetical protein